MHWHRWIGQTGQLFIKCETEIKFQKTLFDFQFRLAWLDFLLLSNKPMAARRPLFTTTLQYLDPSCAHAAEAGQSRQEAGGARSDSLGVACAIWDGRAEQSGQEQQQALTTQQLDDAKGFALVPMLPREHAVVQRCPRDEIAVPKSEVQMRYYRALEEIVARILPEASYVRATNVVLRESSIVGVHTRPFHDPRARGPVNDVHCDFGPEAPAIKMFTELAGKMGLGGCRFCVINCWRNTNPDAPVQCWPMAVCDASSVDASRDLVPRVSPENGNVIQSMLPTSVVSDKQQEVEQQHRWFTFPHMTSGEVLMFKQYDTDTGKARFVPHTAFDDSLKIGGGGGGARHYGHDTAAKAAAAAAAAEGARSPPPRQSCELRALVFFDEDGTHEEALKRLRQAGVGVVRTKSDKERAGKPRSSL